MPKMHNLRLFGPAFGGTCLHGLRPVRLVHARQIPAVHPLTVFHAVALRLPSV